MDCAWVDLNVLISHFNLVFFILAKKKWEEPLNLEKQEK